MLAQDEWEQWECLKVDSLAPKPHAITNTSTSVTEQYRSINKLSGFWNELSKDLNKA